MIALFGYGLTTKAIAKKFAGQCNIYDDSFTEKSIDEFGNNLIPPIYFNSHETSIQIPSPGFPPTHHLINNSPNLISEYDMFFDYMPTSIWISGTNGKTTTTQMIEHLFYSKGAQAGGNIGLPLASMDTKAPIWILETSSFTLHYTKKAYPNIYLLLPIKPDHLTWHKDFEEYEKDKLSPLVRMKEGSVAILPSKYKDIKTMAYCIFYENTLDLANKMNFDISKIDFKEPFLLDALLAMSAYKILLLKDSYEKISTFKIGRHRLEEFIDRKDRLWVNDSKATNVDAAIEALKRYRDKKIHLIIGGDDKGVDLAELFDFMQSLNITLYAIGSNMQKLIGLADSRSMQIVACKTLPKAIHAINEAHTLQSVALLSPAAASLDQFKSYSHRGDDFIELVSKI